MRISDWSSDVCSSDLVAGRILVSDEFVLQSLVVRADALDLADDLGRVVEVAVRPGEQREMQRVARGIERDGTRADRFLRQCHGGAIAEPGAFHTVARERAPGRPTSAPGRAPVPPTP